MLYKMKGTKSDFAGFLSSHKELSFSEVRGQILESNPLDVELIKELAVAELDYWIRSQRSVVDYSSRRLMFDCGWKQCVKGALFSPIKNAQIPFCEKNQRNASIAFRWLK